MKYSNYFLISFIFTLTTLLSACNDSSAPVQGTDLGDPTIPVNSEIRWSPYTTSFGGGVALTADIKLCISSTKFFENVTDPTPSWENEAIMPELTIPAAGFRQTLNASTKDGIYRKVEIQLEPSCSFGAIEIQNNNGTFSLFAEQSFFLVGLLQQDGSKHAAFELSNFISFFAQATSTGDVSDTLTNQTGVLAETTD